MKSATNNLATFPQWKIELASIILEKGSFPDGRVTSDIKAFAAEHGVNFATVRTAYYSFQKKIPQDLLDEITTLNKGVHKEQEDPQAAEAAAQDSAVNADNTGKEPSNAPDPAGMRAGGKAPSILDLYPVGTIIEAEVTHVLGHGAVVKTKDDNHQEGFIYVGNITNKYVTDINKYFRFGDIVRAKVLKYDEIKGQLVLSTKDLPLKEHGVAGLASGWKAEPINTLTKEQARLEALKADLEAKKEAAAAAEAKKDTGRPKSDEKSVALVDKVNQAELEDIKGFVKGVIGYDPSSAAIAKFFSLFSTHGVFRTSVVMAQVAETFEVDLGLLLAEKVGASLNRNSPS